MFLEEFESHSLHREKIIPGGAERSISIGPLEPGSYEFFGEFNPRTAQGRVIDVYSVGVITCRPTMKEAEDYHHHCIIDEADWGAIDNILAMKQITPDAMPEDEFNRLRSHYAHGMGGIPIIGDPDHVAGEIARFARAGLRGIGVSLVNYAGELPFFLDEVLPRLERMGLREPRPDNR